jgi:hypothetical protein
MTSFFVCRETAFHDTQKMQMETKPVNSEMDCKHLFDVGDVLWRPVSFSRGLEGYDACIHRVHGQVTDRGSLMYRAQYMMFLEPGIVDANIDDGTPNKGIVAFADTEPPESWTHAVVTRKSSGCIFIRWADDSNLEAYSAFCQYYFERYLDIINLPHLYLPLAESIYYRAKDPAGRRVLIVPQHPRGFERIEVSEIPGGSEFIPISDVVSSLERLSRVRYEGGSTLLLSLNDFTTWDYKI